MIKKPVIDNSSKNYSLCKKLIHEYVKEKPLNFYSFTYKIKADSQDRVLTIFSIPNDRGLPYQMQIYSKQNL